MGPEFEKCESRGSEARSPEPQNSPAERPDSRVRDFKSDSPISSPQSPLSRIVSYDYLKFRVNAI